jgi:hypothetical protein
MQVAEETEPVIAVVQLLDSHLAEHLDQLSQMLVKKYSFSYYSKASTHIVQYYLQGHRYNYVPPIIPVVVRPSVPRTPINKITPRVVQAWPSASSSASSTPSFSGSDYTDFSSEADDSLPRTPPPPTPSSFGAPVCATVSSIGLEPLNLYGNNTNNNSSTSSASAHATSSNKENCPIVVDASMMMLINGGAAGPGGVVSASTAAQVQVVVPGGDSVMAMGGIVAAGNVGGAAGVGVGGGGSGTRSRKSSLELMQQNIPATQATTGAGMMMMMIDAASMDMCLPSPASREATYVPRAALHLLGGNHTGAAN